MAALAVSGNVPPGRVAIRVSAEGGREWPLMKTKADRRSSVTEAVRPVQAQPAASRVTDTPFTGPRPFLIQALPLRTRRPTRR